jgi:imidazolonepropionase-like amidohydrolase
MESMPLTLMTARAIRLMKGMIDRGFTSVRDTGGADWGIKEAVEKGDVAAPRLFIAGQAIGPTGGHSDPRRRTDFGTRCQCCNAMAYTMNRPTASRRCANRCASRCGSAPTTSRS